jgi:hypothetical protein
VTTAVTAAKTDAGKAAPSGDLLSDIRFAIVLK